MFGYKKSEHPELVKEFFNFCDNNRKSAGDFGQLTGIYKSGCTGRKSGTALAAGRRGIYGKSDRRADEDTGITDRNKIHQ